MKLVSIKYHLMVILKRKNGIHNLKEVNIGNGMVITIQY